MILRSINISDSEIDSDEDFSFMEKCTRTITQDNLVSENMNTFNQHEDTDKQKIKREMINACSMGQLEIVIKYLESNDINEFLLDGWTPLLYATFNAQIKIIEYLINNGVDVNKHKDGYTPLMALCNCTKETTEQRIKCLTVLIEASADPNASNKLRQTPLMFACMSQEVEFILELIKYVKNINAYDNRKQTALMYATIANKSEIIKILIENAADITLTDINKSTAYDIASMKGYDKLLSLLNFNEEEPTNIYNLFKAYNWKDIFPSLINIDNQTVDSDVDTLLYGMGLEKYAHIFQGINLKTFLTLHENDLCRLGMDINAHRMQFIECLDKFHSKKWSIQSIGAINKSLPYTLYNGVISLGTLSKQIAIIGSSFRYIKNSLIKMNSENVHLTKLQISDYEQELKNTQKTLNILKNELMQVKALSKRIEKKNGISIPAIYIGPKKRNINWPMLLSIALIVGIYVSKTTHIQKLICH